MSLTKKTFRYYYWLILEFVKKHIKSIVLSFLVSFLFIVSLISIYPYLETMFLTKTDMIGIIGKYDLNNLPEEITSKISNGLVFINDKGEIIPVLTSSWETLNQGKEYRFHLKDNLIWSDGKKFSVNDINYSFKDVKVKKVGDNAIYFQFDKPLPIFPTYLSKPIIRYPMVGVGGLYSAKNIKVQYGNVQEVSLVPNQKGLHSIVYKFYENETQLIDAYKKGEINQMTISKKSIADVFSNWKNTNVKKSVDYTRLLTLFFNMDNNLLKEKEIRQALMTAIQRNKFSDYGEQAIGPIPPISWAYNTDIQNSVYQPDTAEKIIKKSITSTQSAQIKVATYYEYYDIADELNNDLKVSGLKTNLNIISYEKPDKFDMLIAYWKVPYDPDQYYFWHSTQTQGNIANYKNVKIDKLLEDGRSTMTTGDRKKIYLEFQKAIMEDPPAAFLYYPYIYTISRK